MSDICLPGQIYIWHVWFISDMADIYLAFSPDMGILARHISGWLDIYRDISSYVRPIETLAPKKPDIWQFVTIYIQPCGFMNRFFFQTHIKAGSYALWHDMWAVFLIYDMPLDFYHSKWLDMRAFFFHFSTVPASLGHFSLLDPAWGPSLITSYNMRSLLVPRGVSLVALTLCLPACV